MIERLYPQMVHDALVARVDELTQTRKAAIASLRTRKDALAYQKTVRRKLRRVFAPWPKKTPLNARVTARRELTHYAIESVVFESRPNYPVTANLYIPKGDGPFPVVLGACGHSNDGKAEPVYQKFAAALACQGFMSMVYDPVSQGERHQYEHLKRKDAPYGPVYEHQYAGHQLQLTGDFLGTWRTWDGIRSLDYLLARPEADKTHVGITGNSGGGTLTTFLTAFDDRFTMAAPSCFVTTTMRNLTNHNAQDSEQCPPGMLAAGLDVADFFIAYAPRPTILLGQQHDFFDCRGLREIHDELRHVFSLLGAADNAELFIGPDAHGFTRPNREAMVKFFCKAANIKPPAREPRLTTFKPEQIAAAPGATVANVKGNRFIHELNAERADELAVSRPRVTKASLLRDIEKVLELRERTTLPNYRILRPVGDHTLKPYESLWPYGIETEPGVMAILQLWDKKGARKRNLPHAELPCVSSPTLYVPDRSSFEDLTAGRVPGNHKTVFAVDPRGMGQSIPFNSMDSDPDSFAGSQYMAASFGLMLNRQYLGMRVHDVLSTLDVMQSVGNKSVHLVGRGEGALIATFAGLLHPSVKRVTLINTLLSYHDLAQQPVYSWPLSALPRNVLAHFDLPDCYRALNNKKLKLVAPWGADRKPLRKPAAHKLFSKLGLDAKLLSK